MIWVRSAVFNVWFFGVTAVLGVYGLGIRWLAPHRALGLAQRWAALVLDGAYAICGIELVVTGAENIPQAGAALIASEHQSAFDTLIWLRLVPRVSYIFKSELGRVPLFGPLLTPSGQISVDRQGGAGALTSLVRGAQAAKEQGRQIVIFPEGTRVDFGQRVKLRSGVATISARTELPVIPVATNSGLFWGRRSFLKRPGQLHVLVGAPIPPGLPPAALLTVLRDEWDALHARQKHVDNSVHERV